MPMQSRRPIERPVEIKPDANDYYDKGCLSRLFHLGAENRIYSKPYDGFGLRYDNFERSQLVALERKDGKGWDVVRHETRYYRDDTLPIWRRESEKSIVTDRNIPK